MRGIMLGILCLISLTVLAVVKPELPAARAQFSAQQPCLLPVEIIRREHGSLLKQAHYAATVQQTTPHYYLVQCIACHVTPNSQGESPAPTSATHFCQSCHVFVGTTIECFSCHLGR